MTQVTERATLSARLAASSSRTVATSVIWPRSRARISSDRKRAKWRETTSLADPTAPIRRREQSTGSRRESRISTDESLVSTRGLATHRCSARKPNSHRPIEEPPTSPMPLGRPACACAPHVGLARRRRWRPIQSGPTCGRRLFVARDRPIRMRHLKELSFTAAVPHRLPPCLCVDDAAPLATYLGLRSMARGSRGDRRQAGFSLTRVVPSFALLSVSRWIAWSGIRPALVDLSP